MNIIIKLSKKNPILIVHTKRNIQKIEKKHTIFW